MILGFSGTRYVITYHQHDFLRDALQNWNVTELHHGACVGADEAAHNYALEFGILSIVVHPPKDGRWMMQPNWNHSNVIVLPAKPYHERNRDIVHACDELLAEPNKHEPPLGTPPGGTWYTINYARKIAHKPTTICYPDGEISARLI